ncbi:MAG TPA: cell division protein FtsQ/DivIB [Cellvibrio sp.]|nr:cell division protein FtsQ/DivIB [Cellvibrio sp.]
MKNKPPKDERINASDRLVGANRLFERDVLMSEGPRREPRTRSSIIGDKKLTARDAVARAPKSETSKPVERSPRSERGASPIKRPSVKPSVVEKPRRVLQGDPLAVSEEKNLRRERGYGKISPQGAVSGVQQARSKVTRMLVYRGVGLLLLLSCFAGIAYFVSGPVTELLEKPLKSVAVEGQFQYLSKNRAMELITAEIDGDFLQLNLNRLKNVLQSDPWIEHVTLSRRWPDTLVVKITEQKPIARWDANGFLNQRGEIIRVSETDKLLGLPWLEGNEINAREILQQYQDVATLLRSRGLELIALRCDSKKSWRITLKNNVEIAIGREQVMEKLHRFVTVYDNFLSSVWGDVKAIDVRYTNGVSVRWVPDSAMAKKYLKADLAAVKTSVLNH